MAVPCIDCLDGVDKVWERLAGSRPSQASRKVPLRADFY